MTRTLALLCLSAVLVATASAAPAEELDRSSPQASMLGFLRASRDGDYARAAHYLNLDRLPPDARARRGPVLARQLKAVLDRELWVDVDALSSEPRGQEDDGLPPKRDRVGHIGGPDGGVDVLVERVERDGARVWLIAAPTVAAVPRLADALGVSAVLARLPEPLVDVRLLEIALWQWLALLLLLLGAYLLAWMLASTAVRIARPLVARSRTQLDDRLLALLVGPLRLVLTVGLFAAAIRPLGLAVPARRFFDGAAVALAMFGITWLLFRSIDLAATSMQQRLDQQQRAGAAYFVPLGARALKAAVAALAVLAGFDTIGIDVTALIAGLGVGGIAVALAAQKTLENVFGGMTVLVDQPVRPGEFCRFGDRIGTVESIGLRSTRVRTLDRTIVTVPNGEFSMLQIENFAERDRILLTTTLGLRYETTPDQLRHVIAGLRAMLQSHPRVLPDALRVRLVGFGASSLDLEVYCYVDTSDWNAFLGIREDVYLRMMDVIEESGSGFAFPSQTTYLAKDDGLDGERAREAEARVAGWREEGTLPFPEGDPERVAARRGTLDWPPKGSPGSGR